MVSGAAFHRAYQRATQQAFLEAHEQAFHYFGGVFRLLRYDSLYTRLVSLHVDWKNAVRGKLVAEIEIDSPRLYLGLNAIKL
jgi:hypothetical protein